MSHPVVQGPSLPRSLSLVVPLARGAGPGEHATALATARRQLAAYAERWGGRVDWDSLVILTGPLVDLLDNTTRRDLSGLRATATVVPL